MDDELQKAFDLGQKYWREIDSDIPRERRKSDETMDEFDDLKDAVRLGVCAVKSSIDSLEKQMDALLELLDKLAGAYNQLCFQIDENPEQNKFFAAALDLIKQAKGQ